MHELISKRFVQKLIFLLDYFHMKNTLFRRDAGCAEPSFSVMAAVRAEIGELRAQHNRGGAAGPGVYLVGTFLGGGAGMWNCAKAWCICNLCVFLPIEQLFGVWKRRFPSLSFGLQIRLETILVMIVAVGVLHNIAIESNDLGEGFEPLPEEVAAEIAEFNNAPAS